MKNLMKHRTFPTVVYFTVISVIIALLLGLEITAVVLACNPYFWKYVLKVFRKV